MERKTMIVITIVIGVILYGIIAIAASLSENTDYQKAKELNKLAQKSYSVGDYEKAYEYAEQARKHVAKADAYVAELALKSRANTLFYQASKRIEYAKTKEAKATSSQAYKKALSDLEIAKNALSSDQYERSIEHSNKVIQGLNGVVPNSPLPKYYKVRLIPLKRDCFWNIAKYKFVYSNPWKWKLLYDANRSKLKDPDNPNLIFPGQVIVIPSQNGEFREGTFDSKKKYD
jgi:nucleoid-associated protein YgaU